MMMEKKQLKDLLKKLQGQILPTTAPNMEAIPCTTESLNNMIIRGTPQTFPGEIIHGELNAFEAALLGITNLEALVRYLERSTRMEKKEKQQLIENRFIELLSETNDLQTLCSSRNRAHDTRPKTLIDSRTLEVIQNTNNFDALFSYWLNLEQPYRMEQKIPIATKLSEMIENVSIDNMPEWFIELIQLGNIKTPDFICDPLREKTKQLLVLLD